MNRSIAWTLRAGIALGLILIVIGEFLEDGNPALGYGLLIMISSPLLAVITALICLVAERDWFWAAAAAAVVVIVAGGAILAML